MSKIPFICVNLRAKQTLPEYFYCHCGNGVARLKIQDQHTHKTQRIYNCKPQTEEDKVSIAASYKILVLETSEKLGGRGGGTETQNMDQNVLCCFQGQPLS